MGKRESERGLGLGELGARDGSSVREKVTVVRLVRLSYVRNQGDGNIYFFLFLFFFLFFDGLFSCSPLPYVEWKRLDWERKGKKKRLARTI